MDFKLVKFIALQLLIQYVIADKISDIKYPKNEFNSNDSTSISVLNQQFDLKKEINKDLKKEAILKDAQNENLKLLIKEVKINQKDLPQRDNSKSAAQKEDKLSSLKNNNGNKESAKQNVTINNTNKDSIIKDANPINPINTTEELADLFIGTIVPNAKMADFRNASLIVNNNSKQSVNSSYASVTNTLDDLRIKVIEQVHLKAKIFFQALTGNQLLRESASSIKNKNDALNNKISSIYSSTPYLRPFQASTRPPANSNSWCTSLSNSFSQYGQLNAFLLAAFLFFPITIPAYLLGWLTLFLLRAMFCIGAKQLVTNVIHRIRNI